jgi:bifunctional non-homologous end joining protein LigD
MAKPGVEALLKTYREKRDFSRTAEPDHEPAGAEKPGGRRFVVQKHDATRLHYDFRLEWDGVLKSWAVTRGPSTDPAEKRLAVRTEDHPLAYGGFEGIIPEKEYGGGTVMLWDRGTFEPVGDFDQGLKDGKLVFRLHGERLKGEWTLVRMRARPGEKRENWLMIRHREEGAKPQRGDILKKHVKSVASGRSMAEIAKGGRLIAKSDLADTPPAPTDKPRTRAKAMPRWREPQLATLVDEAPEGAEWLAEMKYDGYRALIAVAGGKARVFTRNGKDWTDKFPAVADAAATLETDGTLLDGEIVAFDAQGRTSFSALQKAIKAGGRSLSCFVFDMMEEGGKDIRALPLVERKARLERLVGHLKGPLHLSTHIAGRAPDLLDTLCASGHEGIVAKRADRPYRSGRGRDWLKVKCGRAQEFVIGGFSPSSKRGRPFASVLVGVFEGEDFVYKGRVGSFEGDLVAELATMLAKRVRKTSPFAELPAGIARGTRFVTPDIVIEVGFAEFTADGVVRHGVAKGVRTDKKAAAVVLETPKGKIMNAHESRDVIAGVKLSSPDKVLFAEQGVTKADLAAHYERVAGRMLPHVEKRLLSLVRCPDGAGGQCFFQKHDAKGFPQQLRRIEIAESDGRKDTYLYAEDLAALVSGVQMGTLEFHIWGSRIDRLEQPDRLVFDLDPDEGLDFAAVRDAAFDIRDRLEGLGLATVPMVTGGKGIHVLAPIARRAEWPEVKAFARGFAQKVAEDAPERYVANMAKAKRKGKIFVDYLRNERGSTAIAPYSTRARKGAPVATPVSWKELALLKAANVFGIADMPARLDAADPWADSTAWRQSITKAMLKAVAE